MQRKWTDKKSQELFAALLLPKSTAEIKAFLRDLLTENEIIEFSKRWQAARMLEQGVSYAQIVQETGLSSTTVARVSKWLKSGKGGYKKVLKRLGKEHCN